MANWPDGSAGNLTATRIAVGLVVGAAPAPTGSDQSAALQAVWDVNDVLHLHDGTYIVNTALKPNLDGKRIQGMGRDVTYLQRGANVIVLDISGASSATHLSDNKVSDLTLSGGYNAAWTEPILRTFYTSSLRVRDCDIKGSSGCAIKAVELWDSSFSGMRFQDSGGALGSGIPAVHILGKTSSGFGSTAVDSNVLNFYDCWWESFTVGAFWVQANGGNTCNQIRVRDCKIETNSMMGEPVLVETGSAIAFENLYIFIGAFGSGYSTATDAMYLNNCFNSKIDGLYVGQLNVASLLRSGVSFSGNNLRTSIDRVTGDFPAAPTGALVRFAGGTNTVRVGRVEFQNDAGGAAAKFSGSPEIPWEREGTGSPESVIPGVVGSRYWRTDGGAGTTLYVKESGTGNTGWSDTA